METAKKLSQADCDKIQRKYESEFGKLTPGSYLHIWISQNGNVMVSHMVENHDWTNDSLIRQVNLGKYEPVTPPTS